MSEIRRVRLSEGTKKKGHGTTSTYHHDNRDYTLVGNESLPVPLEVANGWVAVDSNVIIMPER